MPGAEVVDVAVDSIQHRSGWRFSPNADLLDASLISIRGVLAAVKSHLPASDADPLGADAPPHIPLGHGDPSAFPAFAPSPDAESALAAALLCRRFNSYSPTVGLAPARAAVADHLSKDLPPQALALSADDVYLTSGCTQAIEVLFSVIARPGANVLLPRPGYPFYDSRAVFSGLGIRHYDLVPSRGWEIDLAAAEAAADEGTVAIVIVNPGNPCGNVMPQQHLGKLAVMARKLGIVVIADEVYGHLVFGDTPFVPMGTFGGVAPVISVGSISKRWIVPGWRLGWIATHDPNGVLKKTKIIEGIEAFLNISSEPATFVQGAVPQILKNTKPDFFTDTISLLKQTVRICHERIQTIDCLSCPYKPEGSMFMMVELDLSRLEGIEDDFDFCCKLAEEDSVVILPGQAVGLRNWLRVTFAVDPASLEDGLDRLKSFCKRHAKMKN